MPHTPLCVSHGCAPLWRKTGETGDLSTCSEIPVKQQNPVKSQLESSCFHCGLQIRTRPPAFPLFPFLYSAYGQPLCSPRCRASIVQDVEKSRRRQWQWKMRLPGDQLFIFSLSSLSVPHSVSVQRCAGSTRRAQRGSAAAAAEAAVLPPDVAVGSGLSLRNNCEICPPPCKKLWLNKRVLGKRRNHLAESTRLPTPKECASLRVVVA